MAKPPTRTRTRKAAVSDLGIARRQGQVAPREDASKNESDRGSRAKPPAPVAEVAAPKRGPAQPFEAKRSRSAERIARDVSVSEVTRPVATRRAPRSAAGQDGDSSGGEQRQGPPGRDGQRGDSRGDGQRGGRDGQRGDSRGDSRNDGPRGDSRNDSRDGQRGDSQRGGDHSRGAARGGRGNVVEEEPFVERGARRALSHVGGKVEFRGSDEALRPLLEAALAVTSDEEAVRAHVHGFHSYPARLHPDTARRLVESLSQPGQVVLDPFSGSGTVLVESVLAGRRAVGVDANPLSVLLARVKCAKTTLEVRQAILGQAQYVADIAEERRVERHGPSQQYSEQDRSWFDIHVLLELDGLRLAMQHVDDPQVRLPLDLVFSSVLTKVSRRAADTARRETSKRLASGFTIRHFVERAEELVERMSAFANVCPDDPRCRVDEGDARVLKSVKDESCDLVVTSPPYPGVFDYLDHHELRLRWLGMAATNFEKAEIGARRQMGALGDSAVLRWRADFSEVLRACHRVLRPGGLAAFVIADSVVARRPLWADELLIDIAGKNGFSVRAVASQRRPYFHEPTARAFEERARREHVVVLCRGDAVSSRSR